MPPASPRRDLGARVDARAGVAEAELLPALARGPGRTSRCRSARATARAPAPATRASAASPAPRPGARDAPGRRSRPRSAPTRPRGRPAPTARSVRGPERQREVRALPGRELERRDRDLDAARSRRARRRAARARPPRSPRRRRAPTTTAASHARSTNACSFVTSSTPRGRVERADLDGLDHLGELEQRRVRRAVGGDETVAHERAVVGLVAEVAAVGEPLGAVVEHLHERLVDPVPHEAALQPGVACGSRPSTRRGRRTSCPSRGCTRT